MYRSDKANCLLFTRYKSKRVVLSVCGGETYEFYDAFDASFMIRDYLQRIIAHSILLTILTDSESFFNIIFKAILTTEKWLVIDVKVAR